MTERKNNSDIIEIKNPKVEEVIRKECGKPTEPLTWGNFRSCKWLIALMSNGNLGFSRMEYSPDFGKLNTALRKKCWSRLTKTVGLGKCMPICTTI